MQTEGLTMDIKIGSQTSCGRYEPLNDIIYLTNTHYNFQKDTSEIFFHRNIQVDTTKLVLHLLEHELIHRVLFNLFPPKRRIYTNEDISFLLDQTNFEEMRFTDWTGRKP